MNIHKIIRLLVPTLMLVGAWTATYAYDFGYTDTDSLFRRDNPRPVSERRDTTIHLWKGERGGVAAMFSSPEAPTGRLQLRVTSSDPRLAQCVVPRFLDYVVTGPHKGCGWPDDTAPMFEVADALTSDISAPIAAKTRRPVYATVDIPADFPEGSHRGWIVVDDIWHGKVLDSIAFTIEVAPRTLPAPTEWKFNINMWQQPYAIARHYGVTPWSDEHFKVMDPYVDMLARGGQKTISVILFHEPWGDQSNDKFETMIATTLEPDGSWSYDYSIFDRWVEYMISHGIDSEIECFSMIPWDMNFRYFDRKAGEYRTLHTTTASDDYVNLWAPYLKAFSSHLEEKGWLDRTYIAIDERSLEDMLRVRDLVKANAPGIKLALHGNYHPELDDLDSYTLLIDNLFPAEVLAKRNKDGKISRYYTCCANAEPNIFTNSEPADAAYIPVFCRANDATGYLHWAFFNWTDNPLTDSRFFMFAPGDTYCVYPEGSSLRWERMIEGVELVEKADILLAELLASGRKKDAARITEALAPFKGAVAPFADRVRHYDNLREVVTDLSISR